MLLFCSHAYIYLGIHKNFFSQMQHCAEIIYVVQLTFWVFWISPWSFPVLITTCSECWVWVPCEVQHLLFCSFDTYMAQNTACATVKVKPSIFCEPVFLRCRVLSKVSGLELHKVLACMVSVLEVSQCTSLVQTGFSSFVSLFALSFVPLTIWCGARKHTFLCPW